MQKKKEILKRGKEESRIRGKGTKGRRRRKDHSVDEKQTINSASIAPQNISNISLSPPFVEKEAENNPSQRNFEDRVLKKVEELFQERFLPQVECLLQVFSKTEKSEGRLELIRKAHHLVLSHVFHQKMFEFFITNPYSDEPEKLQLAFDEIERQNITENQDEMVAAVFQEVNKWFSDKRGYLRKDILASWRASGCPVNPSNQQLQHFISLRRAKCRNIEVRDEILTPGELEAARRIIRKVQSATPQPPVTSETVTNTNNSSQTDEEWRLEPRVQKEQQSDVGEDKNDNLFERSESI